jgi:hypothetical protein
MFLRKVYIIGIFKKEMVKKSKNTKTSKTKTNQKQSYKTRSYWNYFHAIQRLQINL